MAVKLNPLGHAILAVFLCAIALYIFGFPGFLKRNSTINMSELLSASIDLAKLGGDRVRLVRLANGTLSETMKGKTLEGVKDVATPGDMQSHAAMYYGFVKAFPNLKVISEEHSGSAAAADMRGVTLPRKQLEEVVTALKGRTMTDRLPVEDLTVWIDPLDATKEYTENLLQYVTTMVCVAVKGRPVIGVIHWPFSGILVWGYVDVAYSSGLADRVTRADRRTKVIISRSHSGEDVGKLISGALGDKTDVLTAGGAGYKVFKVVTREADAYVHMTRIKKWDLCAGAAVLAAVGGTMTTLDGATIDFSAAGSAVNDHGVLATMRDHARFLAPLGPVFTAFHKATTKT